MVEMLPLQSSNIDAAGHDPVRNELFVRFTNGETWRYDGCPAAVFGEFITAESKGKYFAASIKPNFGSTKTGELDLLHGVVYETSVRCPGCNIVLTSVTGPGQGHMECRTTGCRCVGKKYGFVRRLVELEEIK